MENLIEAVGIVLKDKIGVVQEQVDTLTNSLTSEETERKVALQLQARELAILEEKLDYNIANLVDSHNSLADNIDARNIELDDRSAVQESQIKSLQEHSTEVFTNLGESITQQGESFAAELSEFKEWAGTIEDTLKGISTVVTSIGETVEGFDFKPVHARMDQIQVELETGLEKLNTVTELTSERVSGFEVELDKHVAGNVSLLAKLNDLSDKSGVVFAAFEGHVEDFVKFVHDTTTADAELLSKINTVQKVIESNYNLQSIELHSVTNKVEKAIKEIDGQLTELQADHDMLGSDVTDIENKIGKISEGIMEKVMGELKTFTEGVYKELNTIRTHFETRVSDLTKEVMVYRINQDEVISTVRAELVDKWQNVEVWQRGGPEYKEGAYVSHAGGMWQACKATNVEPGESDDWVLIVNGLRSIKEVTDGMEICTADGSKLFVEMKVPEIKFFGTYDSKIPYKKYDSVVYDGNRWLAIEDNPESTPEVSKGWVIMAMRGQRGKAGKPGENAKLDFDMGVLLKQVQDNVIQDLTEKFTEAFDAIQKDKVRWRGQYSATEEYQSGDLVIKNGKLTVIE